MADQALSAEGLVVSPSIVSQLDTDSDGKLSAEEVITAADKFIDGLVSIPDTNGDGALSRDELAVLELLYTGQKTNGAYQPAGLGTETLLTSKDF